LALSTLWALATVALGPQHELVQLAISATYLAWLWCLFGLFSHDSRDTTLRPIRPVVYALAFVEFAQIGLTLTRMQYSGQPATYDVIVTFAVTFRLLFCIGALVLVHNLYAGAAQQARAALRWPAAALAVLWLFDLNLYTITYLAHAFPMPLVDLRGLAMVVMVALMGYGTARSQSDLRFQPSRSFAFRSFSLGVIGGYLVVMVLIAQAIAYAGSDWSLVLQAVFVLMAT